LSLFPPEYRRPDLRELIFQNYRIVYRVKPDVVEIAAIVHGARLFPNLEE
jgi:plasmid stabilization system protein ParE